LQPWQFFVLAALGCATAVTFLVRGHGLTVVITLAVLMGATALVGLASLRAVRPLVAPQEDRVAVVGSRTRAALEREKVLALRAIKDLEFDRAMGKVSEDDFREMSGRLRARATRLMKQLDAGAGYRTVIERDLAKRLGDVAAKDKAGSAPGAEPQESQSLSKRACARCTTANEPDARFCKECGAKL
jgi:ribosomal protein L40E